MRYSARILSTSNFIGNESVKSIQLFITQVPLERSRGTPCLANASLLEILHWYRAEPVN